MYIRDSRRSVTGVLWAAPSAVPATGATVKMEPKDLDLPEQFDKLIPAAKPASSRPAAHPPLTQRMAERAPYTEPFHPSHEPGTAHRTPPTQNQAPSPRRQAGPAPSR